MTMPPQHYSLTGGAQGFEEQLEQTLLPAVLLLLQQPLFAKPGQHQPSGVILHGAKHASLLAL